MSAATFDGPALSLRGVGKNYGRVRALDGLDLDVPQGSIFGLVGRNGAGKTTTFAVACGFVRADQGAVNLLGEGPFDAAWHRGRVAALPQDSALGRDLMVIEQLRFFGRLQGVPAAQISGEVARILDLVGLEDKARARTRTLSHGMLRRLGIGQAFLGNPELVMLDEPTNGLDPDQAHRIREFIAGQRGQRTIIVSSHNLAELEAICDHVALMDGGRVMTAGSMAAVTGRNEEVRITLAEGPVPLDALKAALANDTIEWDQAGRVLCCRFTHRSDRHAEDVIGAALRVLLDGGARISAVSRGQSLERTYLDLPGSGTKPPSLS